jgi:hypothetical protein
MELSTLAAVISNQQLSSVATTMSVATMKKTQDATQQQAMALIQMMKDVNVGQQIDIRA